MWNGLVFSIVSLFTPQAHLPDIEAMQRKVKQFAQVYEINTQRIQIRQSSIPNPSPFLTQGGVKTCTLHVNHHSDAKRVWTHFLDSGHQGAESAFLAFTAAHELTHCLLSEKGRRVAAREALETHLGTQFRNNTQFEETIADLVGLAYLQKTAPEHYEVVEARVKSIRADFSSRDPEHDSTAALTPQAIGFADQLFHKPINLYVAEASAQ